VEEYPTWDKHSRSFAPSSARFKPSSALPGCTSAAPKQRGGIGGGTVSTGGGGGSSGIISPGPAPARFGSSGGGDVHTEASTFSKKNVYDLMVFL
jgi:hypothetical protein